MASPDWAEGTFDTTQPYCANIPPDSNPGTKPVLIETGPSSRLE